METTNTSPAMVLSDIRQYPLEALDLMITVTLNPAKSNIAAITAEQAETICNELDMEKNRLQLLIKTQVFSMAKRNEVELLVKRYHGELDSLLDQSLQHRKNIPAKNAHLRSIYTTLTDCLDSLLLFIENRFATYLGMDERVPATYLSTAIKDVRKALYVLKGKINLRPVLQPVAGVVLRSLDNFSAQPKRLYEPTFRKVIYHRELVRELLKLNWDADTDALAHELCELLICMNFNSKAFIKFLIKTMERKVSECENTVDKIDTLLFWHKAFNQLHSKPGLKYNPNYHDLETVISNWFIQEIRYYEKKLQWSSVTLQEPEEDKKAPKQQKKVLQKVLVQLSSDQAGLIFRAADELRIIVARSLSEVFRSIAPHLSTPYSETVSYEGMRVQSYVAEQRDKEIAIETLERIIERIKEFNVK
ncbi:hypothetical protein FMM05_19350 [Flavobacterium zepuense]|uniref:Uncharacterized protein n=1 Tax=Flavobacterium zepuense TaxID=2593302 RepID=A0A552UUT0_9FLAO|nr:hypothetical protein [Flavobacterium zepuense]TRW21947.1 hypothetical protein FMM05_19350 [Flavobacterium zepuense]